ncbi:MAG: hypothetical protein MK183_01495, partial [Verrucomicrobiales bacterium]|nr:hypothetical protein [Verrucomicrobiales bacterium]
VLVGCLKYPQAGEELQVKEVSGQAFIVTQGGENIKIGLLGIHLLDDEQFRFLSESVINRLSASGQAVVDHNAQVDLDREALKEGLEYLNSVKKFNPQVGAKLDGHIVEARQRLSGLGKDKTGPSFDDLVALLRAWLSAPVTKTDADGRFTITLDGPRWIIASSQRKVGNSSERYLWAFRHVPPGDGGHSQVFLSNDNLVDGLRAFAQLSGREWSYPVSRIRSARPEILEQINAGKNAAKMELDGANRSIEVTIRELAEVRRKFSAARGEGGQVVAWGSNSDGESTVPSGLRDVVMIAAGSGHSLAIRGDDKPVAWGNNENGQSTVPPFLKDVVQVAAGGAHYLALRQDGKVGAWGRDNDGQARVPDGLKDVVQVAAGFSHSLALRQDGTVIAWGLNLEGQAGVPLLDDVVQVAAGKGHSLALRQDGTVFAWGLNSSGQSRVPDGLDDVVQVAAGETFSLALREDGKVVAWGRMWKSDKDSVFGVFPGLGEVIAGEVIAGLDNVVQVAAGKHHLLALRKNGTVMALGSELGERVAVPVGLEDVVYVAAGENHSLALIRKR